MKKKYVKLKLFNLQWFGLIYNNTFGFNGLQSHLLQVFGHIDGKIKFSKFSKLYLLRFIYELT